MTADYERYLALVSELGAPRPTTAQWASEVARTLLDERDHQLVGYVRYFLIAGIGHVRHLAVAPRARGAGIGRALMHAVADALRARGVTEWQLHVEPDNAPAIRISEQLGMAIEHRSTVLRVPVSRIPAPPHDAATVLPIDPAEDDDIERALGLLSGRIAMLRTPDRLLFQARDAACAPVGFAAFDPASPGPLHVTSPVPAGPLLAALARETRQRAFQVVVEDDRHTVAWLHGIGAETRLQLLELRGRLD